MSRKLSFLPGTMCDDRLWSHVRSFLPSTYRVNLVPLYKANDHEHMHRIIAHAIDPATHLIGFSMGAYLGTEYVLQHPGCAKSLTIICGALSDLSARERQRRHTAIELMSRGRFKGLTDISRFVHESRMADPAVAGVVRDMNTDLGKAVFLAQMTAMTDRQNLYPILEQQERVQDLEKTPVHSIFAQDDKMVRLSDADKIKKLIPGVRIDVLPETGHMAPLEKPKELAELIIDFVEHVENKI
ncbi:Alpha/Beta hydrolase protein [Lipomyces japonicus]|uniref:Alpha/Beta hydrolase protein n=1 Tax=Lipomyces japonicus TaxID=56871 RepID=UPI0034CDBBC1